MSSTSEILSHIDRVSDKKVRELSYRLVNELASRSEARDFQWTFKALSRLAGVAPDDPKLLESVQFLATIPRANFLTVHFYYFDPKIDDSSGVVLQDTEVIAAYAHGYLIDPISGDKVKDFEDLLVPFFQISDGP